MQISKLSLVVQLLRVLLIVLIAIPAFSPVRAIPADNNIFGMSSAVTTEQELIEIARLVNSSGGDWGYVTVVIQETDRDTGKWTSLFNKMSELHLIPIVRLATQAEGSNWKRPTTTDASSWVDFLDSLPWPVTERYIVLFNEPNHGQEWGGSVHPENYGQVAREFAMQLETRDPDFFVMIAGLDAAAPSQNPGYEDMTIFLNRMFSTFPVSEFNQYISGWASHSYPNPGFRGKPTDTGRSTIQSYAWELNWLKGKGVKDLPVFIKETGWPRTSYNEETIAHYYTYAFREIWFKDSRVQAVTPFIFNYESAPFQTWSWKKTGGGYYAYYNDIQNIPKIAGKPPGAPQVAGTTTYVYRFWSSRFRGHFYTTSPEERNYVIRSFPNVTWLYEGVAYMAASTDSPIPVYRFWSKQNNAHFFTANPAERDQVIAKYKTDVWKYEGVAYHVYPANGETGSPVYRFWSSTFSKHFYTASLAEKDYIHETFPEHIWKYEGIAWNVPN